MKIEKQFNRRGVGLVEVQSASISTGVDLCLGIKATFFRMPGGEDISTIAMHLTPDEALHFAIQLIAAARVAARGAA